MTTTTRVPVTHEVAFSALSAQLDQLALFRGVLADEVGAAFRALIDGLARSDRRAVRAAWGELFTLLAAEAELYPGPLVGDAWQNHLLDRLLVDENPFSQKAQHASLDAIGSSLVAQAYAELRLLQRLYQLDALRLQAAALRLAPDERWIAWDGLRPLGSGAAPPAVASQELKRRLAAAADWGAALPALAEHYAQSGTGLFARYRAFRWVRVGDQGRLEGIAHPDLPRLEELVGYEAERELLLRNTEHFLAGYPANNVLLYGDRGTGKSSTIKALLTAYGDRGLRLIEVSKAHLSDLPQLLRLLRGRRERFVLFIDDLSFHESETDYKELKAVLEGGLEARPPNVLLYATSNRRHLVQERFDERGLPGDGELHAADTMQEKLSLSDRFGITLTFLAPDQERYLHIVQTLAAARGLPIGADELRRRALAWAMRHKGRSGRTARQFIDYLTGELGLAAARAADGPERPA
ncbi:MAG TPA: ATP-binding protein [Chloroflexota bacterium]|nr:ATP-binding protein [Chloroflexota bacterium]